MAKAFDIVMEHRKQLVLQVVELMKQGEFFTIPLWDRSLFRPHNPISGSVYRGGNRLRLMLTSVVNDYTDPRWATRNHYAKKGYQVPAQARPVHCEHWKFTEIIKKEDGSGKMVEVEVPLEYPKVSYFSVFNAQQIPGFPVFELPRKKPTDLTELIDKVKASSECPIEELPQGSAYYDAKADRICLPPREAFKDEQSFAKTMLHEMSHSTGHPMRLDRPIFHAFGTEAYAREELRAELGSLFLGADLQIPLTGEHYQDHSNYLNSWIGALEDNVNELFRACADAEKSSNRIMDNYRKMYNLKEPDLKMNIPDAVQKQEKSRRYVRTP